MTVTELRDSTFHALITIVRNGTEIELDARTSDAIALALRSDAKIFAADEVIEESGVEFEGDEEEASRRLTGQESLADLDPDEFRRFLDTVSPDEFAAEPDEDLQRRASRASRLGAELPLRQVEQLGHEAVEALAPRAGRRSRPASVSRRRRSRSGSTVSSPSSAFSSHSAVTSSSRRLTAATIASSFAVIWRRISSNARSREHHRETSASALKIPCTTMPG